MALLELDEIGSRERNGLPLPLAGEGWAGGVSANRTGRGDRLPPPAALNRAPKPKLRFGVLVQGRPPMAAYAPPQAGEVKQGQRMPRLLRNARLGMTNDKPARLTRKLARKYFSQDL